MPRRRPVSTQAYNIKCIVRSSRDLQDMDVVYDCTYHHMLNDGRTCAYCANGYLWKMSRKVRSNAWQAMTFPGVFRWLGLQTRMYARRD